MNGRSPRLFLLLRYKALVWFSPSPPQSLPFSTAEAVKRIRARKKENPFVVDYLINSCGLSAEKAVAASASLISIKSPEKPDCVLSFLRTCGLSDAQITSFVSNQPKLLSSDVEKFLAPKFKFFQNVGMSSLEIAELMQKTRLLSGIPEPLLARRIEFLRSFVSNDQELVKVVKKSVWSLTASKDICNRMKANVSKFKQLGMSDEKLKLLLARNIRVFQLKSAAIDMAISRVDRELGIPRTSGMYFYALINLCSFSDDTIRSRFQILKDFGWSMSDITALFRRQPPCLAVSDEKLRRGLEFLMKIAGLNPSYIAKYPTLLMLSLDKRVSPRYDVFTWLKSKSLIRKDSDLYGALSITEESFRKKYVMKFKQEAPEVFEAYMKRVDMARKK